MARRVPPFALVVLLIAAGSAGAAAAAEPPAHPEPSRRTPAAEPPAAAAPAAPPPAAEQPPRLPADFVDTPTSGSAGHGYHRGKGSGFWTSDVPAEGHPYRWGMMAIGGGVALLMGLFVIWLIRRNSRRPTS